MGFENVRRSTDNSGRIAWLDHAKGLCIILVVMLYATESTGNAADQESWLHAVAAFAQPFRMPDFFLLSGLLLARVIQRDWRTYVDRKVVHFAYFYFLWLAILIAFEAPWAAAKHGWPAVAAGYLKAHWHPYSMLWFIYLLPVFFVVTKLAHRTPAALVWAIAAALQVAQLETGIKVLDKFAPYYVFFYSGFILAPYVFRFADGVSAHRDKALVGLAIWAAIDAYFVIAGYAALPLLSLALAFAGAAAVIATAALVCRMRAFQALGYCGRHSIVIYLAFYIPLVVTHKVLAKTGLVSDVGWQSLLATTGGVLGALALYRLVRGTRFRFLFERPAWLSLSQPAARSAVAAT